MPKKKIEEYQNPGPRWKIQELGGKQRKKTLLKAAIISNVEAGMEIDAAIDAALEK